MERLYAVKQRIWCVFLLIWPLKQSNHLSLLGELVYLNVLGKPIVVINSYRMALEMLERKSSIYSDRPTLTMGSELCGYNKTIPLMSYGSRFRASRKFMHQFMGTKSSFEKYGSVVEEVARRMVLRLLQNSAPNQIVESVRK
jgi:hypothetical protein